MKNSLTIAPAAALVTVLILAAAGCGDATSMAGNHDADIQALKDNETQWNKDFDSKDAAKLAAHYTDDAVLMNPGRPPRPVKTPSARRSRKWWPTPRFRSSSRRPRSKSPNPVTWPIRMEPTR